MKEVNAIGKMECIVCSGYGHEYTCFRRSKKKTKLGCPTKDFFGNLATAKTICGSDLDKLVNTLSGLMKPVYTKAIGDINVFVDSDQMTQYTSFKRPRLDVAQS